MSRLAEARTLAERIMSDEDTALDAMAREELGIDPDELGGSAAVAAVASFVPFTLGAAVPVLPFVFLSGTAATVTSVAASAGGLFLLGSAITLLTHRGVVRTGHAPAADRARRRRGHVRRSAGSSASRSPEPPQFPAVAVRNRADGLHAIDPRLASTPEKESDMTSDTRSPRIVVGYDGSAASRAAVARAADRAGADGQLYIVHAYSLPMDWLGIPNYQRLLDVELNRAEDLMARLEKESRRRPERHELGDRGHRRRPRPRRSLTSPPPGSRRDHPRHPRIRSRPRAAGQRRARADPPRRVPGHRDPRARRRARSRPARSPQPRRELRGQPLPAARGRSRPTAPADARWLRTPVRAFMRPGVVTVAEDASLLQVQRAMIAHAVHAVLIVGTGGPVGWITAGGLLPWLGQEPALYSAVLGALREGGADRADRLRCRRAAGARRPGGQPPRRLRAGRRASAGRRERDRSRPPRLRAPDP